MSVNTVSCELIFSTRRLVGVTSGERSFPSRSFPSLSFLENDGLNGL